MVISAPPFPRSLDAVSHLAPTSSPPPASLPSSPLAAPPSSNDGKPPFETSRDYMQSLARGLVVLRTFDREHARMSMATIAARSRLSRAAVRRIILTLLHLGYVRTHGREYGLSPRVLELGYGYLGALNLADIAVPWMEDLSHRVGESCAMGVLDGRDVVHVASIAVRRVANLSPGVGTRLPAFCSAMGRLLFANLPREQIENWLLGAPRERRTPYTTTDGRRLIRLIDEAREHHYAYVEQEVEAGLCTLAVPVRNRSGRVAAALSVDLPHQPGAQRRAIDQLLVPLKETVASIERAVPAEWLPAVGA
jgi:IclR family transcriptional regulator, pca regulon regulatory protein